MRRKTWTICVWDDELAARGIRVGKLRCLEVARRHHADAWQEDVRRLRPLAVLLDADMGADHRPGWEVNAELHRRRSKLPIVCISRNPVAIAAMEWEGALVLPKEAVGRFLERLDARLSACDRPSTPVFGSQGALRSLVEESVQFACLQMHSGAGTERDGEACDHG